MSKKREGEKNELIASVLMIFVVFPLYLYERFLGGLAVVLVLGWLVAFYPHKEKDKKDKK